MRIVSSAPRDEAGRADSESVEFGEMAAGGGEECMQGGEGEMEGDLEEEFGREGGEGWRDAGFKDRSIAQIEGRSEGVGGAGGPLDRSRRGAVYERCGHWCGARGRRGDASRVARLANVAW